ncbi:hypothetical protein AAG570_000297 [Ranatra chinensis]|uniref:Succinate dehydrogenase assembly factor 3 n=1 Tax=Ranatra chinensis TaxID=642074 RepID=A0ABD0YWY6_9HEMI
MAASEIVHRKAVLSLYKILLRLHRGLPEDLQTLGTCYIKDEFRRHKLVDQQTANTFMVEWTRCALLLTKQLSAKGIKSRSKVGNNLGEDDLEKLREDQAVQLYELMKITSNSNEQENKIK